MSGTKRELLADCIGGCTVGLEAEKLLCVRVAKKRCMEVIRVGGPGRNCKARRALARRPAGFAGFARLPPR